MSGEIQLAVAAPYPQVRSRRGQQVAQWFGLVAPQSGAASQSINSSRLRSLLPRPGEIVFITGPSGAGKSSLLNTIRALRKRGRWIDLNDIVLPDLPLVDCFGRMGMQRVLRLLSQVGLAEAWTYLRTPSQLSDGQRWRLRLAMALGKAERKPSPILICDEFCALLDRVTAAVVARSLRRAIDGSNMSAIVASSHDDLQASLKPDLRVDCDFGCAKVRSITSRTDAKSQSAPGSRK